MVTSTSPANAQSRSHAKATYDAEYWNAAFREFRKKSNEFVAFDKWLKNHVRDILPAHNRYGNDINILSIGCGAGEPDIILMDQILLRLSKAPLPLNYIAVDPSLKLMTTFKDTFNEMREQRPTFKGISCDFRVQSAENCSYEIKFDLVLMVQVLFFIKDVSSCLANHLKQLRPRGLLCIVLPAMDGPVERGYKELDLPHLHYPAGSRPTLSCDVRAALDALGPSVCEYQVQQYEANTDIELAFDAESDDGELVLDFILDLYKHRTSLTSTQYEQLMQWVASPTVSRIANGRRQFIQDMDVYIVSSST